MSSDERRFVARSSFSDGLLLGVFAVATVGGCSYQSAGAVTESASAEPSNVATVLRTSFGIPHIRASNWQALGYGQGYADAEDYVCTIADQVIKVRSERARYYGAGEADAHVASDVAMLALGVYSTAKSAVLEQSDDVRALLRGYVAGYNEYIHRVGPSGLPSECNGASWVKPIEETDVLAHAIDLSLLGERSLIRALGTAAPPVANQAYSALRTIPTLLGEATIGSNGWAIGRDRAANGRGMLLANPHLPLDGELKLHEVQLTVPGVVNAYGASLVGVPGISIGFNDALAWTHTTSPSLRLLLYRLKLDPTDPTRYEYDGELRAMDRETVKIAVGRGATIDVVERTIYRAVQGPIVAIDGLGWTEQTAYALQSSCVSNTRVLSHTLGMLQAGSLDDVRAAVREQGAAWATTLVATRDGEAYFVDSSRVPNLSESTLAEWQASAASDAMVAQFRQSGVVLLDGSRSSTAWQTDGEGHYPFLVPLGSAPSLVRSDYVFNSNDSYWIANETLPLIGFSPLFGNANAPLYPRTRMNIVLLRAPRSSDPPDDTARFSLEELQAVVTDNKSLLALLIKEEVVARCKATPLVAIDGVPTELSFACAVLEAWDGTYRTNSKGAVVFRELLGDFPLAAILDKGELFANGFDASSAADTPNTPVVATSSSADRLLHALAHATKRLSDAGIRLDAPLGDVQYMRRGSDKVPVAGCLGREGCLNALGFTPDLNSTLLPKTTRSAPINPTTGLTRDGYVVNFGSSFVLAVEYRDDGPYAKAVTTYSESADERSAHFRDQSALWSAQEWRPVLFRDADIASDLLLKRTELVLP